MRKYFTWIFAKPYLGRIILYFVLVCLATVFSIASILSASNFLNVLFSQELSNTVVANPSLLDIDVPIWLKVSCMGYETESLIIRNVDSKSVQIKLRP
jgi:hypothetical protein